MTPPPAGLVVERSPISEFLASQRRLDTPVARFARAHEAGHAPGTPEGGRTLIPLTAPGANEQYAFSVDLDQCTGCKACVAACHSLNGLDEEETWRDVGTLIGGCSEAPYQQTITSACHHCEDPGCLNGCPVLAYEKDPVTGIVRHLDDQCIGCQYCVLKCPYDVPKFSPRLGIVRKCDMCHSRLAAGEAPACAQACPTEAISITIVPRTAATTGEPANPHFPEAFPAASITYPATRYVSRRPVPANARAADRDVLRPQHAHWPLVWMLVLTQAAAGLFLLPGNDEVAFVLFAAGIGASVAHLGRPLGAWRAFLGLRRSWMSREVVVFGQVLVLGALLATAPWLPGMAPWIPLLHGVTAAGAILGVFCSAMIYADTGRRFWRLPITAYQFFGTVLVLGAALGGVMADDPTLLAVAALAGSAKLVLNALQWRWGLRSEHHASRQSSRLLRSVMRRWSIARGATALAGALALLGAAWLAPGLGAGTFGAIGCALLFAGEVLERALFFKATDAPKMPGGLTS